MQSLGTLCIGPLLHDGSPLLCGLRIDIEDREAFTFADADAQHAHTALNMVDLLQFDLLPSKRDQEFSKFAYFRHVCPE